MDDNKQAINSTLPVNATGAITDGAWILDAGTVYKSSPGNVGIGTSSPSTPLEVNGIIKTTALQLTTGAAAGRLLQSDANGNASWVANPGLTETDPKIGANTTSFLSKWNGTQLVASTVREDAGNVGIGVTGAVTGSRLQVNSVNTDGGTTNWIAASLGISLGNANRLALGVLKGEATVAGMNSSLSAWSNLLLNPGDPGNVGIGLDNPSAKLHVDGTMRLGGQGTPFSLIYSQDVGISGIANLAGAGATIVNIPWPQPIAADATIIVNPKSQLTGGMTIGYAWRSGANQISVYYINHFNSTSVSLEAHILRVTVINFEQ
jgi:hypothetical protein